MGAESAPPVLTLARDKVYPTPAAPQQLESSEHFQRNAIENRCSTLTVRRRCSTSAAIVLKLPTGHPFSFGGSDLVKSFEHLIKAHCGFLRLRGCRVLSPPPVAANL